MSIRQLVVFAMAAGVAVTGCGKSSAGSDGPTKAQLVAEAEPICARFWTELHSRGIKSSGEFVHDIQRIAQYDRTETEGLRRLSAPAALASDWRRFVEGHEALDRTVERAAAEARAGRLHAIPRLLSGGFRVQAQTVAIVRRDGFRQCARSA